MFLDTYVTNDIISSNLVLIVLMVFSAIYMYIGSRAKKTV